MKPAHRTRAQPLHRIFAGPAILAFASIGGLMLGLTGDGLRDGFACFLLFLPLAFFAGRWFQRN